MRLTAKSIFLLAMILIFVSPAWARENGRPGNTGSKPGSMVLIPGGKFKPLFSGKGKNQEVSVKPFYLDKYPVTNREFLEFVTRNPKWRRSNIKTLFADKCYLRHWAGDLEPGSGIDPDSPVTNVSWFAAKAFCEYAGKRLPSSEEWEFAALAGKNNADGLKEDSYLRRIQEWYSQPSLSKLPAVGTSGPNYWGVYDLHGLVWEWTDDFYSTLVNGESRNGGSFDRNLFCGSGASGASDFKNYAAFMRYAFRSSLKANYAVFNLGFRCAKGK